MTESRARTGATPTDLPREEVAEPGQATSAREARDLQREEFGGFSWGSVFFGWLVALGLAALLTAILSGAGTAIGITELSSDEATDNAETVGLGGAILLLAVLLGAY